MGVEEGCPLRLMPHRLAACRSFGSRLPLALLHVSSLCFWEVSG